mmetsp:Transcript_9098/g.19539  ORF Transcript_9098/g.19539 Transcript_9098/m.19539 type:complete len:215 (-) Transcript_9098:1835-2479(-)
MGYVDSPKIAIGLCRRNHRSVALLQPCLSKRGDPIVVLLDSVYEAEYLCPLPLGEAVLRPLLCGLVCGQVHEDLFSEHFIVGIALATELLAIRIVLELERRRIEPERCFVVDVAKVALLIRAPPVGVHLVSPTCIDVIELYGARARKYPHVFVTEFHAWLETFCFFFCSTRRQFRFVEVHQRMNILGIPGERSAFTFQSVRKRGGLLSLACHSH